MGERGKAGGRERERVYERIRRRRERGGRGDFVCDEMSLLLFSKSFYHYIQSSQQHSLIIVNSSNKSLSNIHLT